MLPTYKTLSIISRITMKIIQGFQQVFGHKSKEKVHMIKQGKEVPKLLGNFEVAERTFSSNR